MSGLFAKREQNKLLKAFNEAIEVKRLNSHSYEAILETGDIIKASLVINCQFESSLEVVINNYGFYSGVRLTDELKELFVKIQNAEHKYRDRKFQGVKARNLNLWDNTLSV